MSQSQENIEGVVGPHCDLELGRHLVELVQEGYFLEGAERGAHEQAFQLEVAELNAAMPKKPYLAKEIRRVARKEVTEWTDWRLRAVPAKAGEMACADGLTAADAEQASDRDRQTTKMRIPVVSYKQFAQILRSCLTPESPNGDNSHVRFRNPHDSSKLTRLGMHTGDANRRVISRALKQAGVTPAQVFGNNPQR